MNVKNKQMKEYGGSVYKTPNANGAAKNCKTTIHRFAIENGQIEFLPD